jgi:hypothetical protein
MLRFLGTAVASLAWPLAVVIIVLTFRRRLSNLLDAATTLRYREWAVDFHRSLDTIQAQLAAKNGILPPSLGPEERRRFEGIAAAGSPEKLIDTSWGLVERELRDAVARVATDTIDFPMFSTPGKVDYLRRRDRVDAELASSIEGLARLRNQILKGIASSESHTDEAAARYAELAFGAARRLAAVT